MPMEFDKQSLSYAQKPKKKNENEENSNSIEVKSELVPQHSI